MLCSESLSAKKNIFCFLQIIWNPFPLYKHMNLSFTSSTLTIWGKQTSLCNILFIIPRPSARSEGFFIISQSQSCSFNCWKIYVLSWSDINWSFLNFDFQFWIITLSFNLCHSLQAIDKVKRCWEISKYAIISELWPHKEIKTLITSFTVTEHLQPEWVIHLLDI